VVSADPIALRVVAGTWKMPERDQAVTFKNGQTRTWQPVRANPEGAFDMAGRSGYLAIEVLSTREQVKVLDSSGHAMVYINGQPRVGDSYAHGYVRLPVRLRQGANTFLFQAGRSPRVVARLSTAEAPVAPNLLDVTVPDLIVGQSTDFEAAVAVLNAQEDSCDDLEIVSKLPGGDNVRTRVPSIPPLGVRKVGFAIKGPAPRVAGELPLSLAIRNLADTRGTPNSTTTLSLRVRSADQTHRRTFRSQIDGSVQYYAVVPAKGDSREAGLVLTLHGAAVEAIGQAEAYAPKPGLWIVAPTNRRPYGFDWEDWGRLDALEVLDVAQRSLQTDPHRSYLTGHSMGGHGTWHLGVTMPDRFAAVAPSAGWISMMSYAGLRRSGKANAVESLVARAANPSDTLALVRNLAPLGVFVLHGEADDNVPVGQARRMREVLGTFHPDFVYHEEHGAGHWWGPACVDWPPLFTFLNEHRLSPSEEVRQVDFTTMNPGISAQAHWATIEAQLRCLDPSTIHLALDPGARRISGTTENVARLALDMARARPEGNAPITVELDGQTLRHTSPSLVRSSERIWLTRKGSTWSASREPHSLWQKGPHRSGPFKEAFRHRFVLVYGTKGTSEENDWALSRARYDSEVFWYRGNGSVDLVADTAFLDHSRKAEFLDRGVILFGHAECNAAWPALLGQSPIQVRRGRVTIGSRQLLGDDLACLFLRPRPDSDRASVGVVAGTGMTGMRLTERLPYFIAGVAYPDCTVFSSRGLEQDGSGVQAAGFFGTDWSLESGEFVWR
jgi:fermentation-respiration switch protein FrsA (DUF1100 family)